ncbi:DUF1697 domain-containing protein [Ramlibacter sp. USB13]|uniref:DUF1697 domain-containing protein n=1 Tax=Ramlibacter cellulosilyticus TaxID=2764187 RepID=A0A923MT78_9BURK|nr:DUF1697 domain-containing protein [Ramlibacter cellulosilyticus]MBC5784338.1 DUF1697 domain-containing protein [Ramlibacter cellulosilyticus]
MPRQAAFLRGVSPMNCRMAELKAAYEAAGFTEVRTVLASGNVVFGGSGTRRALEKKAQAATEQHLEKGFRTFVRRVDDLRGIVEDDPFRHFRLPAGAKRIVTFLADGAGAGAKLPVEMQQASILAVADGIAFGAYVPLENDPAFMRLIEKTFGKDVTTRTWDTLKKVCAAA